jgi:hypothetical protein
MATLFDNEYFQSSISRYNEVLQALDECKYLLLRQYDTLDTQEFDSKQEVLLQIQRITTQIDETSSRVENLLDKGNRITSTYDDAEARITEYINGGATNLKRDTNTVTNYTPVLETPINFKNVTFSQHTPTIFSKLIATEDWLISLIEKL